MESFKAFTGKALTTVVAGFALTTTSCPNIILLPALVAGLTRVLIIAMPGRITLPVFFTSLPTISVNELITLVQSAFFRPVLVATASANAPLVMALPPDFMALAPDFMTGAFMAFMAFMVDLGAMVARMSRTGRNDEWQRLSPM